MVNSLRNHPSIVMWVPFNERWGQHETVQVARTMENLDITRLLNIASGGNFFPAGDVADIVHCARSICNNGRSDVPACAAGVAQEA